MALIAYDQTNNDIHLLTDHVNQKPINNNVNDVNNMDLKYLEISDKLMCLSLQSNNLIQTKNEQYKFITVPLMN